MFLTSALGRGECSATCPRSNTIPWPLCPWCRLYLTIYVAGTEWTYLAIAEQYRENHLYEVLIVLLVPERRPHSHAHPLQFNIHCLPLLWHHILSLTEGIMKQCAGDFVSVGVHIWRRKSVHEVTGDNNSTTASWWGFGSAFHACCCEYTNIPADVQDCDGDCISAANWTQLCSFVKGLYLEWNIRKILWRDLRGEIGPVRKHSISEKREHSNQYYLK